MDQAQPGVAPVGLCRGQGQTLAPAVVPGGSKGASTRVLDRTKGLCSAPVQQAPQVLHGAMQCAAGAEVGGLVVGVVNLCSGEWGKGNDNGNRQQHNCWRHESTQQETAPCRQHQGALERPQLTVRANLFTASSAEVTLGLLGSTRSKICAEHEGRPPCPELRGHGGDPTVS